MGEVQKISGERFDIVVEMLTGITGIGVEPRKKYNSNCAVVTVSCDCESQAERVMCDIARHLKVDGLEGAVQMHRVGESVTANFGIEAPWGV